MVHKAHLLQRDPRCDTRTVLKMARRLASKSADMNAVRGLDTDWNLHWADSMAKNHFNHIKPSRWRPIRPCSHAEGSARPDHLTRAQVKRYRKRVGRRWVIPFTVAERQAQARRLGVKVFWELKSSDYAIAAERFVAAAKSAGGKWAVMTLINMRNWQSKLEAFHEAGAPTYLMMHGHSRNAEVIAFQQSGRLTGLQ
jgi:hypothetical protein